MPEPMLCIHNRHSLACGDPPIVNSDDPDLYIGYFENRHGEQWVFTYNRKTGNAELRGGDIGWNTVNTVVDGIATDLILGIDESTWLKTCWCAEGGLGGERAS
jgi:hypothetical protein